MPMGLQETHKMIKLMLDQRQVTSRPKEDVRAKAVGGVMEGSVESVESWKTFGEQARGAASV